MPAPIKVYPTKPSALSIPAIPGRPKLTLDGVLWPRDSFTMRRLSDRSVTEDPALAYKPTPAQAPVVAEVAAASTAPAAPEAASAPTTTPASDPAATAAPPSSASTAAPATK